MNNAPKSRRIPEEFQRQSIDILLRWFEKKQEPYAGGVLALPTGGGKTFTAVRFISLGPLSQDYKVLWLAQTNHLLEQAFSAFGEEVGHITSSRNKISLRIVSGQKNHFSMRDIKTDDDIIFTTLSTSTRAYNDKNIHPNLERFLESTDGKLFVVFDEAHHAGAYTYFELMQKLRKNYSEMYILGLTATPKRPKKDNKENGTLKKLFPQGNLYKISTDALIGQNILAKPVYEQPKKTEFIPEFPDELYTRWKSTHRDIPENIITQLADNAERNEYIADTYYQLRKKYGKTIIFADRWYQCISIRDYINKKYKEDNSINSEERRKKDKIAGAIFHHVKKDYVSTSDASNDNIKVLDDFKNDKLDVIVNIRMLTEGTDVPNAHTVFLTRQTTSEILMTQMVGRALRGPKFHGTPEAFIVPFIDNWEQNIIWVAPEIIEGDFIPSEGDVGGVITDYISINAVIGLIDELYSGKVSFDSYLHKYIPVGWYQTEYEGIPIDWLQNGKNKDLNYQTEFYGNIKDTNEYISINNLIMVFETQKEGYFKFIDEIQNSDISAYAKKDVKYTNHIKELEKWCQKFFSKNKNIGPDIRKNLFFISCHVAQNGEPPNFFNFDQREEHDLDSLAQKFRKLNLPFNQMENDIINEYNRQDLYWNSIYPNKEDFLKHFMLRLISHVNIPTKPILTKEEEFVDKLTNGDLNEKIKACENLGVLGSKEPLHQKTLNLIIQLTRENQNLELQEAAKKALSKIKLERGFSRESILKRDSYKCLCCGETKRQFLQIDHIVPRWIKEDDSEDNLQTLCKFCNGEKEKKIIDFRNHVTPITKPSNYPDIKKILYMEKDQVQNFELWEKILKRKINMFYECNVVKSVNIGKRGYHLLNWEIDIYSGNNPKWIEPSLKELCNAIHTIRDYHGLKGPNTIKIKK